MEVNYVLQCRCNLVDEFHLSICLVITVQRNGSRPQHKTRHTALARWAWSVGSVRQGQLRCFESLSEDRQALSQLNHIPGQQERVNF